MLTIRLPIFPKNPSLSVSLLSSATISHAHGGPTGLSIVGDSFLGVTGLIGLQNSVHGARVV